MRQYFFIGVAVMIPLAILGWFIYALGRGFLSMYEDWKLGKDLDQLQAEAEGRREQKRLENEQRLANGCEHDFDSHIYGLPSGVCGKCGLEREKPTGACDHVWRLQQGAVPSSECEKCGRTYNTNLDQGSLA
jgi:hypothetical protein